MDLLIIPFFVYYILVDIDRWRGSVDDLLPDRFRDAFSRLFDEVVWNNRNFMEFYSADYSVLTSDLAALYGVKPPVKEPARVDLPEATERAGVVGHARRPARVAPAAELPAARGGLARRWCDGDG